MARCAFSGYQCLPQMHQEEEARMTFPLRGAPILAPVATTVQGEVERAGRGGETMCSFHLVGLWQAKSCSQTCTVSVKLNGRRIKISKESVPCWAFSTLLERLKMIWTTYLILMSKIFYLTQTPNLDTSNNNYFYWEVKISKFSNISPFVQHTESVVDSQMFIQSDLPPALRDKTSQNQPCNKLHWSDQEGTIKK